jgi:tetratricopeptide (TPR) repeat protein
MLPFVILLYAWWKRGRIERKDFRAAAPFFGLSLLLGLVTVFFQFHRALSAWTIPVGGLASRFAVAGPGFAFYLWKSLVPLGLHPIYEAWSVEPPTAVEFLPWLALALLLGGLWTKRTTWGRPVLFGLGFFLLNLVPVVGFVPMSYMHFSWVADHFAYLPLLGLVGLGTAAAGVLQQRAAAGRPGARVGLGAAVGVLAFLLAWASRSDAGNFRSDEALWRHTLRYNPQAWLAHIDLGKDLFQAGRLDPAVDQFNQALAIRADLPEAYYNRGSTFLRLGRLPEAERDLQEALRLQPASPDAETNLGNALARSGQVREAIPHYEEALRLQPEANDARANLAEAHCAVGNALAERRQFSEAIDEYRKAVEARPDSAVAHGSLGNALFVTRRFPEAIAQYEEALRLDPSDGRTQANLNLVRRAQRNAAP